MLNTIYTKLSAALLALFLVVGIAFFLISRITTEMYYQEITQRLNAPVAMYVANDMSLIEQGEVNQSALKILAQRAMVINPTVEVYLTDTDGNILAHAHDKNQVKRDYIDLNPVKQFIAGSNDSSPMLGDDPKQSNDQKIFSAAEVRSNDNLEGYIYIILGGEKYDNLVHTLKDSYVAKLIIIALISCLSFGLICGLILFARLTKPLQKLTQKVELAWESAINPDTDKPETSDEIERLNLAFEAMTNRIDQQMKHIQQTDATRRELITNISHDLRTPLTTLQGYIETLILKHDTLDIKEQQHYLEIARQHGVRLGQLIGELFELAKLDSNIIKPNLESFSLTELVNDIVQEFRLSSKEKNIELSVECNGHDCTVYADISLMQRVFENLLKNALRHTPNNGAIKIRLDGDEKGVHVTVSDNGCGIAQSDIPFIFDRFYHSNNAEDPELKSTGLGLAIVKRILELHQTVIQVDSKQNSGTSFYFHLPDIQATNA